MPKFVSIQLKEGKEKYEPRVLHATHHFLGDYFVINSWAIPFKLPFVEYDRLSFDPSEKNQAVACMENGFVVKNVESGREEEILPHAYDEKGEIIKMKKHGPLLKLTETKLKIPRFISIELKRHQTSYSVSSQSIVDNFIGPYVVVNDAAVSTFFKIPGANYEKVFVDIERGTQTSDSNGLKGSNGNGHDLTPVFYDEKGEKIDVERQRRLGLSGLLRKLSKS